MHQTAAATPRDRTPDRLPRWFRQPLWALVLGIVLFPAPLFAIITISVQSVSGSRPIVGSGGPVALLDFGRVSAFEPLAAGVTRTLGASDYTLSSGFGVRVTKVPGGSSYTLQARLQSAHVLTWRVDGVTLSTSPVTVATMQPFSKTIPHTLAFQVPYTHASGLVTTIVEVTAIAN